MIVFTVMHLLPGDVVLTILSGSPHTEAMRESLREELGLNRPLPVRYGVWLWRMVTGEFGGHSLETREPIRAIMARQAPVTALLACYALVVSVLLSVPLGVLAAV